jgi:hypothetical protein
VAGGNERLELVIDLAQAQIAVQFAGAIGIDGLGTGILLFDSALAGTIIATAASIHPTLLDDSWGFPLAGLVLSAFLAFVAATIGGMRAGPKLSEFNARIERFQGDGAAAEAQASAVAALLETIEINRRVVQLKEGVLGIALLVIALTFVSYGLYTGRDLFGKVILGLASPLVAFVSSHGGQLVGLLLVGCLAALMVWIFAREGYS